MKQKKRPDILAEYERLGREIERALARRQRIRRQVASAGTITTEFHEGTIVHTKKHRVASLAEFAAAGYIPRLKKDGLIRVVRSQTLKITRKKDG